MELNNTLPIKDSAKTIVCYGDSNTWGSIPRDHDTQERGRYPRSIRWTGVLQNLLGDSYEVINEGLSARTLVAEDHEMPHRTGITHLRAILRTNDPIDLITVMLGTNDSKDKYNLKAEDIALHLDQTIKLIKEEGIEKIIVISPAEIVPRNDGKVDERFTRGPEITRKLPELYKKISQDNGCIFLNAQDYVNSSKVDGFHLDAEMHRILAETLKTQIMTLS